MATVFFRNAFTISCASLLGLLIPIHQQPLRSAHSFAAAAPPKAPVLTCDEVRSRVGLFLDLHFTFKNFDDEISRRTFKKIFEGFDPGKNYFISSDIQAFNKYEDKIDDLVLRKDCGFLNEIQNVYDKRVAERNNFAFGLIGKPIAMNPNEEIPVGKQEWANSLKDLDERWRKRIVFQVFNLRDVSEGSEEKARDRLKKRYEQSKRRFEERTQDDSFNLLLNAFALGLDPHSSHFLPEEQDDFNIRLGNRLEGIGATLQEEDGYITVQELVPGGAAFRDGRLAKADKIVAVDSGEGDGFTDIIDMDVRKAVRLIRGKQGTKVKLIVLRKIEKGTERIQIDIIRDAVQLTESQAKSDWLELNGKRIGVIRLPSFYTDFQCRQKPGTECTGSAKHVLRELRKLEKRKLDGLILDLRNNGGGDLQESIKLTGLFIPEGTVVQTVDRRRITKTQQDQDPDVAYAGPLAVMISKYSASASEIVSGALQDYGRALVLGDSHTYGKATVQVVQDLPGSNGRQSNGAMKVTQAKFYRPSGKTNQEIGVGSDIVIPSILEAYDVGEKENDFVLKADIIRPAPDFKSLHDLQNLIPTLRQKSEARIASSKEFKELKEKMTKAKLEKDKTTMLLKDSDAGKLNTANNTSKNEKSKTPKTGKKENKEKNKPNTAEDFKVIMDDDIQLKEAASILTDAIAVSKNDLNWVSVK